jgi:hypothetical protein
MTKGTEVHFNSLAGPCLPAKVMKVNRTTISLDFYGSTRKIRKDWVHEVACQFCPGNGYHYDN